MGKQLRNVIPFFRKKPKEQIMISIPDPCNEKWAEMKKVDDCQRHCAACDRVLTDFVHMSDDELMLFFRHSRGKICGRFRADQLNRPITPLPEKTSKAIWWKAAALLPFTLFSKSSNAQQLQPDSVKTEQVPYMVAQNDSVAPVPIAISTGYHWNWYDNEEGHGPWGPPVVLGGVPMVITQPWIDFSGLVCTYTITLPDTIPKAESTAGVHAAASPAPKKIPTGAAGLNFANNLHTINPKKEE